MSRSQSSRGIVVQYPATRGDDPRSHESVTRAAIAKKIAALKGYDYAEDYDAAARRDGHVYFVPDDTLTVAHAREIGIASEDDLFGGVVPYPFVATKTITHPLVDAGAYAPEGWSHEVARRMQDVALPGYAAFSVADARRAGERMLEHGCARIKPARGIGGNGQSTVSSRGDLDAVLGAMDPAELSEYGVVIELNLGDVTTYSVGSVHVSGQCVTYCGTQRLTTNGHGAEVYGGSDLLVARGDFDALLALELAPEVELAVSQARRYDAAASEGFAGFLASRRNYDMVTGCDGEGRRQAGVLEQSWRVGGASPAEMAAFEAFQADKGLRAVRASSVEVYGEHVPPSHAVVHFCGVDPRVGRITKYSLIEPYENAT
jgi:hypothetical protein